MTKVRLDEGLANKDSVARILDRALDAVVAAAIDADLGPSKFFASRTSHQVESTDLYAIGADRGGIDERWFSSTTEAANDGRVVARRF